MRKITIALFLILTMLWMPSVLADSLTMKTENGMNGSITYPFAADEHLNERLQTRLGISDALILLRDGAEIRGEGSVFAFTPADGTEVWSVRFTQQGKIRFGRYGQVTNAVLLNAATGEELSLDVLFENVDDAQSALDAYVEEIVLPQLNTYLDASDMLPVPLDNVSLSAQGMTIHYPADRFSFFSGNSGAVEIKYYEIAQLLHENALCALAAAYSDAKGILPSASEGCLYGLTELRVGDGLHDKLTQYGTLTEPDYIADGEIYEFEAPQLRGVQVLAERGAENDEAAAVTGIRSYRLNLGGLQTGVSHINDCRAVLGSPDAGITLDADTAENYRVREGTMDSYAAGEYTLNLYYDGNGILQTAEVRRR